MGWTSAFAAANGRSAAAYRLAGLIVLLLALGLTLPASAQAGAPVVTTGTATELHFNRAVAGGTVNPFGASLEQCLFEYGETPAYTKTAPCKEPNAAGVGSGTEPVQVHAPLSGLKAATEYHFRLTAKNASGTVHGADATFTTLAAPQLSVTVSPGSEYVIPGHLASFRVIVTNIGQDETSGPIKIKNFLPAGLNASSVLLHFIDVGRLEEEGKGFSTEVDLAGLLCPTPTECRFPGILSGVGFQGLRAGEKLVMTDIFEVPAGVEGTLADFGEVSGGGAPSAEASATIQASAEPAFGHLRFASQAINAAGEPYTQAGGHPYEFSTEWEFATVSCASLLEEPENQEVFGTCPLYDPRNITANLPPGLIVNPQAVPHCTLAAYFALECEQLKVAVGTADLRPFDMGTSAFKFVEPVLNLESSDRYPGELGVIVNGAPFIIITSSIRDGSHYEVNSTTTSIQAGLNRTRLNLWGVPANPAHDSLRAKNCTGFSALGHANPGGYHGLEHDYLEVPEIEEWCARTTPTEGGGSAGTPEVPFLTMPTECSGESLIVQGSYDSWQRSDLWAEGSAQLEPVEACNALSFEPTIAARPTTTLADAPSGLEFELHVPQDEEPEGVATPELKESLVTLPVGIRLNPASANGRRGCSEAQANLHVEGPSECPDASKLGEAEIVSSLLHEPLKGSLFLATPHANPFGALLAVYLSVEGQGIRIKSPGRLELDQRTGQITTRFPQNPQLPFEDLKLRFFGGALGALRTPSACGVYQTTSELTPFSAPESGPPAEPTARFETSGSESGGPCPRTEAEEPYAPRFTAGTETPQAGTYSPFTLKLVRDDGSQELSKFNVELPPGLTARLAGIPYCPDAVILTAPRTSGAEQQAAPSCPPASEVGTVDIASGAGPTPIHVPGKVYLAGPYKGAPLSLAFLTPVLAGPFDLGTTVVRAAVYLDPETVQNHVVSDPLPTILRGIPLDIRSITVKLDRRRFMLNPTSCEEFHFAGSATSVLGAVAPLSERFQVGDCAALRFKPRLRLDLSGDVGADGHPRLRAVLRPRSGDANLARTVVTLPSTELLDNAHLRKICSGVQFEANECPSSSVYGTARAETPLLPEPLEGPVYLRSSTHRLPDLVAALHSGVFQINVHLHAKEGSAHGSIRSTFEGIPDVPLHRFVLSMQGGGKGLLVNSVDLCSKPRRAQVFMEGHNASQYATRPNVRVACPEQHSKHRHHRHLRR